MRVLSAATNSRLGENNRSTGFRRPIRPRPKRPKARRYPRAANTRTLVSGESGASLFVFIDRDDLKKSRCSHSDRSTANAPTIKITQKLNGTTK
jgi:hypothetical protein